SVAAGTLTLGASGVIPDAGNVAVTGTLDLAGFSEGIGALGGAGTVTSSVAGAVTLTVGLNNGAANFSGVLQHGAGTVGLTKQGSGPEQCTGGTANTYTGPTKVNAGILALNKTAGVNALGSTAITVGDDSGTSDTLRLDANNQIPDTASVTINAVTAGAQAKF